jgi:uncharacterized membrane protein
MSNVPSPPIPPPPSTPSLDIGEVLSETWSILMKDVGLYIGATLVYVAIIVLTCGLGALVWAPLFAGMVIMAMKSMKGEKPSFDDAFAGFKMFAPLLLLSLVTLIGTTIGFVLCILPGLYLSVAWCFGLPLVIDRKMDFWEALQLSMQTVNQNFFPIFLVVLVLAIINSLGGTVVLGFLITQPMFIIGLTVTYSKVFGLQPGPVVQT